VEGCCENKINRFLAIASHNKNIKNKVETKEIKEPQEEITFQEVNESG